jgi:hypothetical protein
MYECCWFNIMEYDDGYNQDSRDDLLAGREPVCHTER